MTFCMKPRIMAEIFLYSLRTLARMKLHTEEGQDAHVMVFKDKLRGDYKTFQYLIICKNKQKNEP